MKTKTEGEKKGQVSYKGARGEKKKAISSALVFLERTVHALYAKATLAYYHPHSNNSLATVLYPL